MKKLFIPALIIILVAAFAVRLFGINNPVADWHSWRQADTSAVARNFFKFGFDLLRPRYDDLSNIQSGLDNPNGWRMVEFPVYQFIGAGLYTFVPKLTLEEWLRLTTIAGSVLTSLLLGLMVTQLASPLTGLAAAAIFAFLPYNIYYGRTILPDPFMVFWSVLSIFLLLKARPKVGKKWWLFIILSAISAAVAILVKPVAVFLLLPEVYLWLKEFKFKLRWLIGVIVFGFISLVPFIWWRRWESHFPAGIAAYTWLLNAGNIRFKGAWFYWLFWQRLADLILGSWGIILFALGCMVPISKKEGWFFRWWAIGALLYLIIIARGNVQHDYYQIMIIPAVSIYAAKGLVFLVTSETINRFSGISLALISIIFTLAFSWYTVRTYYWINRPEIILAGQTADQILPKKAKVIAPYNGDTTFLYQINRQGWPIGFDIDKKIAAGAGYYVTVSPTDSDAETKALAQKYTVLVRNGKFAIIDLTRKK